MDTYTAAVCWIFGAVALLAFNIVDGIGLAGNVIIDACAAMVAVGFVAYKRLFDGIADAYPAAQ